MNDSELPRVSDALMFSRSYAAASPYLSKTAREHINGLCKLLEVTQARFDALTMELKRLRAIMECNDPSNVTWKPDVQVLSQSHQQVGEVAVSFTVGRIVGDAEGGGE